MPSAFLIKTASPLVRERFGKRLTKFCDAVVADHLKSGFFSISPMSSAVSTLSYAIILILQSYTSLSRSCATPVFLSSMYRFPLNGAYCLRIVHLLLTTSIYCGDTCIFHVFPPLIVLIIIPRHILSNILKPFVWSYFTKGINNSPQNTNNLSRILWKTDKKSCSVVQNREFYFLSKHSTFSKTNGEKVSRRKTV